MVEAKGATPKNPPGAKVALDKSKAAAASKSVKALAGRKKTREKKDNRPVFYGTALVFVALIALVIMLGMKKKPVSALTGSVKSAAGAITRKARKAGGDSTAAARKRPSTPTMARSAPSRAPREKGLRQRQPLASRAPRVKRQRGASVRTPRIRGQGSKNPSGSNALTAIGEGTAMIDNRPVHVGDVIRGRVIQEIGTDEIKVGYGGTVFSVRIGEALP